jgi:hypothetical protein
MHCTQPFPYQINSHLLELYQHEKQASVQSGMMILKSFNVFLMRPTSPHLFYLYEVSNLFHSSMVLKKAYGPMSPNYIPTKYQKQVLHKVSLSLSLSLKVSLCL